MGQQREAKTLAKFQAEFNGYPGEFYEFAEYAKEVKDCRELSDAAADFLGAKQNFERVMRQHDVEVG